MTEILTNAIGAVPYFLITVGELIQPEEIEDIAVFVFGTGQNDYKLNLPYKCGNIFTWIIVLCI